MSFLRVAVVYLSAAVVVVPLATRLGLGSVLGYLVAGVVIGPHGLGLAGDAEQVLPVAEFGVVLLLFLVGLELDPRRLLAMRRDAVVGVLQVVLTSAAVAAGAIALGAPWRGAIVAGLGLSLSSTALVVQLLEERHELATPQGRLAFGILLVQDLAVIPMLAVLPVLGNGAATSSGSGWLTAAKALAVIAGVIVASRLVARPVLRFVAGLRSPDLFTATALLLVVATALLVASTGLSQALGAFLAGVLLGGCEYRRELEADIAPFKGLLLGLFFLAVGMTADVSLLAHRPLAVLGLVLALLAAKAIVAGAIGRAFLGRAEPALALAVLLSQGGEFAFVLFRLAARQGAVGGELSRLLVLAVTLSMATTPALFALHRTLAARRLQARPARAFDALPDEEPPVIVAGFGRVGQVVARVLAARRVPFTAIDASAEHIDFIRRFGNRVFYGDVSRLDLLRAAHVDRARIFVLAIDDVEASMRTAELVRTHFPDVRIVARARNRQHAYRLRRLGIEQITRETLAGAIEMTGEVLEGLGVARDLARAMLERFRAHDEALFERSWRHQDDLEQLTDITRRGREELEKLFEADLKEEGRRSA